MREYYDRVGEYFDEDEPDFDRRYWSNPVLQRIRQAFREEVRRRPFTRALEVGCGTGLDLAHFARLFPDRQITGVDVSNAMVEAARSRAEGLGLTNVRVERASTDDARDLAGSEPFDMCFVFFGALNTVEDLGRAAEDLYAAVEPGAHLVLTFVNRWYPADMLIHLLRGRPRWAFARLRDVWGGYSPIRDLPSRCMTPAMVERAFGRHGARVTRRGFSIVYPAWYRARYLPRRPRAREALWRADEVLNRTPAWCLGEYALYVYRKEAEPPTR